MNRAELDEKVLREICIKPRRFVELECLIDGASFRQIYRSLQRLRERGLIYSESRRLWHPAKGAKGGTTNGE